MLGDSSALGGGGLNGSLAHVRLFTEVLTSGQYGQITALSNAPDQPVPGSFPAAAAAWPLDEGGGTVAHGDGFNNMVLVSENIYDNGNQGGDGLLTELRSYYDDTDYYATDYLYDPRDRQIGTLSPSGVATIETLDNDGDVTKTLTYGGIWYAEFANDNEPSGDLRGENVNDYDPLAGCTSPTFTTSTRRTAPPTIHRIRKTAITSRPTPGTTWTETSSRPRPAQPWRSRRINTTR